MLSIIPDLTELNWYLEFAKRNQCAFEYNDFMFPGYCDQPDQVAQWVNKYQSVYKDRTGDSNKRIDTLHGAFYDVIHFSCDEKIRNVAEYRMNQSMEIAEELNCRGVIFHTNLQPEYCGSRTYLETWYGYSVEIILKLLERYPDLEIYFENMLDQSPDMLANLAQKLMDQKRFGVCFDIAHSRLKSNQMQQWFEKLSPYIRHFHLNDHHLVYDDHLALGDGLIDWKEIHSLIQTYHLEEVSMLLEVRGKDKILKSFAYLNQIKNQ